jgi:3-deoxy-7-phosphoheptulonate synthase
MSDPMHGNTQTTSSGIKTRNFEDILTEIEASFEVHESMGSHLGGVHFELTGDDVTECVGAGLTESDLDQRYASLCDPRLNYRQSLEMAFRIAHRMAEASRRAKG